MTSVADHLSSLTSGWELIQNAFADTKSRLVNIAPDRLTTLSLTVTAATSSTALDKHMIYDVLGRKQNLVALRAKIVKVTPKMRKPRSFFLNSASLQYKDASGPKGIKIFQNGRLHVTGCKSSTEVCR